MLRPCAFAMRTMRLPGVDVGRRVAGLREDRALEGAAEEGLAAVHDELRALRADLPQAEADRARVAGLARLEGGAEPVEHGRELVPEGRRAPSGISTSNEPPDASHETSDAFGARPPRPARPRHSSRNVPRPGPPVALPILPRTTADRVATRGKTCRSSIHVRAAGRSSIRPTMPFQLHCVWSVTLCELRPTSTTRRLSTRIVSRCFPGSTVPRSCSWGVERLSFEPDDPAVEPGDRLPVRPLEVEHDAAALPLRRDDHVALVPRGTDVVLVGLQPERHLDVAGLPVRLVARRGEEGPVDDLARPLRVDRDVVARTPAPGGRRGAGSDRRASGSPRRRRAPRRRGRARSARRRRAARRPRRAGPRRACRGAPPCGRRGTPRTSRRRGPSPAT